MNWAAYIWLAMMVFFVIVEAACPLHLVSVWFAVASLIAMIISLFGGAIWLQIAVFLVVSGGLLLALWPLVKKYMKPKVVATNIDSVVGMLAHVTEDINNIDATGQVKVNGLPWTARSTGGQNIPKGTLIRIDRVEGVKLLVSPAEKSE